MCCVPVACRVSDEVLSPFFFFKVYLFLRERERERDQGGAERERVERLGTEPPRPPQQFSDLPRPGRTVKLIRGIAIGLGIYHLKSTDCGKGFLRPTRTLWGPARQPYAPRASPCQPSPRAGTLTGQRERMRGRDSRRQCGAAGTLRAGQGARPFGPLGPRFHWRISSRPQCSPRLLPDAHSAAL